MPLLQIAKYDTAQMPLSAGWQALALKLQEASVGLTHGNVRDRLSDAVSDLHKDGNSYGHYIDHDGDGESGNCVYYSGGETCMAPYTLGTVNGKLHASIDHENRTKVTPQITYHPAADDSDHYTAMEEAELYQKGTAHLVERFISKGERDKADAGDFAGKAKSFPILKPGDVGAAVHAMGRAGAKNYGMSGLKSRIIAIAKKKGWTSHLPKSWQDGGEDKECNTESAIPRETDGERLLESAKFCDEALLREAGAMKSALVKIISPGRGSSGYYTEELLRRDGPEVFKPGTLMYINHATDAEEAARPEGDWEKLAAVTTGNAYWDANGKAGPAMYAPADVFTKHADEVKEKAPHTGVSIRARGHYVEAASGLPKPKIKLSESKIAPDGKPGLIGRLIAADSIDLVTKAGRDGKLLFESASHNLNEGGADDMTEAQLREVADLRSTVRKLTERLAKPDAESVINEYLGTVYVTEGVRAWVRKHLLERPIPLTAAGDVDRDKMKALAEAATVEACELIGAGKPEAMGSPSGLTEAQIKERSKEWDTARESVMEELAGFVMGEVDDGASKDQRKGAKRRKKAFLEGRAA